MSWPIVPPVAPHSETGGVPSVSHQTTPNVVATGTPPALQVGVGDLVQFGKLQEAVDTLKTKTKELSDQVFYLRLVVWGTAGVATFAGVVVGFLRDPFIRALVAWARSIANTKP